MPLVAVAVAIGSVALGGGAAIGALVAGTATLAETLTAVATIGAVTSAVGAVTGNKDLSLAGTIMGAVGGVGALAADTGLLGADATTASLFGSSDAITAPDITPNLGNIDATMPDLSGANGAGGDFINTIASNSAPSATSAAQSAAVPAGAGGSALPTGAGASGTAPAAATGDINETTGTGGLINSSPASTPGLAGTPGSALPPSQAAVPQGAGSVPVAPGVSAPVTAAPAAPSAPAANGAAAPAANDNGIWSNILSFANKNPIVAYSAVNAAGSLVSGLFNPVTPAQVNALNAQAASNNASAAQTAQQTANMQSGVPVASRTNSSAGLINSAPVQANVTGNVAA